ncbi:DUF3298 and DUF4163 domain-containing protein [Novosphingobium sp. NPDC080210]|uniref:DUF3298 and DUF4163 domain-containing protein n=1 Tax=Novosphingobium sp. NPDC080210 TaxID=3390596 RepID=UPI003D082446
MRAVLVLASLILVAACGKEEPAPAPTASDAAVATAPASEAPPPAEAVNIKTQNPRYSFSYAYPAAAAGIPALKAQLDNEMAKARAELASIAKEGESAAKAEDFEFNPFDQSTKWTVVTDLPGWLSLKRDYYEFTGGAHGNYGTGALLWDKAAGQARDVLTLFVSKAAFDAALRPAFCNALDKQRAERRGAPVDRNSGDSFDDCLAPSDVTVLLGSSNKQQFNRIGLIADPYAAGPYAEGSYEVTLPVTPALLKAVKPEYRAAFAAGR